MIFDFTTKDKVELNQVGGKGKALIKTTKAGFPVPEGFVLSVNFFDEWLSEIKSSQSWTNFLKKPTKEKCNKILENAENILLTSIQKVELDKYLSKISCDVFAVRSSSPEEDLEGSSFAGMYETYLGVTRENLEQFIAKAFSSCFDFRVMVYKKQNNIPIENTAIAIIIQKQVQSDVSGVGFSLNPLNNAYDEVVINASFGLGEAIVSGMVTPDIYTYDFPSQEIIDIQINNKEIALWLKKNGGIEKKNNEKPNKQALSNDQITELSKLIKKCEVHFNQPIDTEWAYENNKLYILQARPITTYLPLYPELVTKPL